MATEGHTSVEFSGRSTSGRKVRFVSVPDNVADGVRKVAETMAQKQSGNGRGYLVQVRCGDVEKIQGRVTITVNGD